MPLFRHAAALAHAVERVREECEQRRALVTLVVAALCGTLAVLLTRRPQALVDLVRERAQQPCIPVSSDLRYGAEHEFSLEESVGALIYHLRTLPYDSLTAPHIGDPHCVAVVRSHLDDSPAVLVNPRVVGESLEHAVVEERDPLCNGTTRFRRAYDVVVRYLDPSSRRRIERRFDGETAHALQHAIDVLEAREICARSL